MSCFCMRDVLKKRARLSRCSGMPKANGVAHSYNLLDTDVGARVGISTETCHSEFSRQIREYTNENTV